MRFRRAPGVRAAGADDPSPAVSTARAKAAAVRLLARREYSRAELEQRLLRRGFATEIIDTALAALAAAGYLSDARTAESTVAQKAGQYGRRAIQHTLRQRGIGTADIAAALAPLADADEFVQAREVWLRRYGAPPASERERARQIRFLQARGYTLAVALRVLRAAGTADLPDDICRLSANCRWSRLPRP